MKYLTRREAADFLNEQGFPLSWKTLQKFATTGGGPEYEIFGNRALYQPPKLLQWAQDRLKAPRRATSEAA